MPSDDPECSTGTKPVHPRLQYFGADLLWSQWKPAEQGFATVKRRCRGAGPDEPSLYRTNHSNQPANRRDREEIERAAQLDDRHGRGGHGTVKSWPSRGTEPAGTR